jgi:hypothetical protein
MKQGTLSRVQEAKDTSGLLVGVDKSAALESRDDDLPFELHALEICLQEVRFFPRLLSSPVLHIFSVLRLAGASCIMFSLYF